MINSKGFGGNNASATLLSPKVTRKMMKARYSGRDWKAWKRANEAVLERQKAYDEGMIAGSERPVYRFDHGVLHDEDVHYGEDSITVGGREVSLDLESPVNDMHFE